MAVVGEANIIVKAITTGFDAQLRRQLQAMAGSIDGSGRRTGESLGKAFSRGFTTGSGNVFQRVATGLKTMYPEAQQAAEQFKSLVRTSYTLGTGLTALLGGISALIGGLVTLVAAVGRALPAVAGLASAFLQLRLSFAFASFALGGISQAVSAATKQTGGLGKSIKELREEFQQLQFQAEEAALSESRAALNLENALENLRRTADLPPNSAARRDAQLTYEEAELAYRRAKDRTKDLNEEVAKGPEALAQGAGGDPYAGLTKSQEKFARYLVGLRPKLDILKEKVASGFLPVLQTQIEKLVSFYFPSLEAAFDKIGDALGKGAVNFTDNFLTDNAKAEVETFFKNLEENIPLIGDILGELGEVLLKVFNDANGIGTKFLTFVRDTLVEWNTYLDEFGLESVFGDAYATGTRIFGIIGNIINGLADFFTVLNDSGAIDSILDYFEKITSGFASLIDENGNVSANGRELGQTFKGLADNFGPVVDFLGQVVESFLRLGANPAIGEFFEKLASEENQSNWDSIFQSFANAAPALGDLIVSLGELFAAFADEGAPTVFFETLNSFVAPLADFFGSDLVKPFLDDIARVFAFFTAIGFILDQIKFFFMAIVGTAINFLLTVGGIVGGFKLAWKFLGLIAPGFQAAIAGVFATIRTFGGVLLRFLGGPWGLVIGLLITGLQMFFTQTDLGKQIWQGFVDFITGAWNGFLDILGGIGSFISDLFNDPGKTLVRVWANVMNFLIERAEGFINFFIDGINNLFGGLRDFGNLLSKTFGIGLTFSPISKVKLGRVPQLAAGGVVMPSRGGTLAQIAEAGRPERVEPLDANGLSKRDYAMIGALRGAGGGINITVNPSPGMDERELAALVSRRIAFEIKRGTV